MKRKALLKEGDDFVVLEESSFEAERALQEALERYPEAIPVADLELDRVIVVGREVSLAAGAIDLLLVDAQGRVLIVETKLSRNPELRRQVVAQVLDYGAALWKAAPTVRAFEKVALRYWHSDSCQDSRVKSAGSLRDGVEAVFAEMDTEEWDYNVFEEALQENLASGHHILLVVASGLMGGLSRDLLQYANICLGIPLYGVEITMFKLEDRELIVPTGVRYRVGARGLAKPRASRTDEATFLETCDPLVQGFFEELLTQAREQGMIVYWGTRGFSVRIPLDPPLTVILCYPPNLFQVYVKNWPREEDREAELRRRLDEIAPRGPGAEYTHSLNVDEKTEKTARTVLRLVWDEVDILTAEARAGE